MTADGFSLGSKVSWSSQARGSRTTKVGEVVEVVPPGGHPDREKFPQLHSGAGVGLPRDHESYVVIANRRYYWPRVSALEDLTN